jgi:hypothetical protein
VAPLSTICAIHTGRGLRYGIYFRRFPKNYRPSECTIVSHLCPPRGNPCLIGTIDAITLQIITILGPLRGLAALLHTPKRLAAGLDATAVRGRVQLVCHSLRDCIILLCCVKATLTTVQGAYILQSLDLKIALEKYRCFCPRHVHHFIALHGRGVKAMQLMHHGRFMK